MFKKLVFVLLWTISLTAEEVVSIAPRTKIEQYGLRVHVQQSSGQFEKICDLAKIDSPSFVGIEYFTGLIVLIGYDQSECERIKTLLEKENYTVEIIKLHCMDYTIPPELMDDAVAGRLCIMPDPRMCIMLDKTTWSWCVIPSNGIS